MSNINNEPLLEIEEPNTNQMKSNLKVFKFEGKNITFDLGNGDVMVNVTEVAKAFPNKNLTQILNSKEMLEYLQELENQEGTELQICSSADSQYITIAKGGFNKEGQGTWVHQRVAIRIAQKLSPKFSVWVDKRIEELMKTGSTSFKVPQTYSEALRLVADQHEEMEQMKPKVQYTDEVLQRQGLLPISTIGQDFGLTAQFLNKFMHWKGYQYKQGGFWKIYKKYSSEDYAHNYNFQSNTNPVLQWTEKGRKLIHDLLKDEGIHPLRKDNNRVRAQEISQEWDLNMDKSNPAGGLIPDEVLTSRTGSSIPFMQNVPGSPNYSAEGYTHTLNSKELNHTSHPSVSIRFQIKSRIDKLSQILGEPEQFIYTAIYNHIGLNYNYFPEPKDKESKLDCIIRDGMGDIMCNILDGYITA